MFALVDSGATVSIFKEEIAQELNVPILKGKEIFLGGVGGRIKGYLHNLDVKIGQRKLIVPVVFSYEYLVSFNLLGREGVFQQFKILFDEKNLLVSLQENVIALNRR